MKSAILLIFQATSLLVALIGCGGVSAFSVPQTRARPLRHGQIVSLAAKKNKGFSNTETSKTPPKKSKPSSSPDIEEPAAAAVVSVVAPAPAVVQNKPAAAVVEQQQQTLNSGQRALEDMRRGRAEEKDAELRRVRDIVMADEQIKEAPASIPEPVAQRMGKRMLPFVGVPLFGGIGAFVGFWYFATYKNIQFQPALVASSTIGILVVGLVGITYSVMSASWDPDREGSFFGGDEFQKNIGNIREGLGRSRENTLLREKMAGLSQGELKSALTDLEKREKVAQQRSQQSLQSKLDDELE